MLLRCDNETMIMFSKCSSLFEIHIKTCTNETIFWICSKIIQKMMEAGMGVKEQMKYEVLRSAESE